MEELIRKKWVIALLLHQGLSLVVGWMAQSYLSLALMASWIGASYYFAYKMRGTKWLSFLLILFYVSFFYLGAALFDALTSGTAAELLKVWNVPPSIGIFQLATSIYYCFYCYKLRQVNRLYQSALRTPS